MTTEAGAARTESAPSGPSKTEWTSEAARVDRARSALDDAASRRPGQRADAPADQPSTSKEEERTESARSGPSKTARVDGARSALDDASSRRPTQQREVRTDESSTSKEEERTESAPSGPSKTERQAVMHCPYCAEETLFPREQGWECRSCLRAFSVTFLGLIPSRAAPQEVPVTEAQP